MEASLAASKDDHAVGHWHNFPAGLRLLVVDDDPLCLKVVEKMALRCDFAVTTCTNATAALSLLRERDGKEFDLVLSDVYMPDMDGFKLLEVIGLEMDLPVIIMSSNGDTANVLRGVTHGACDYLIKPVRLEELRNIWQHVVRRRRQHNFDLDSDEQSQEREDDPARNKRKADAAGFMGSGEQGLRSGPTNSGAAMNGSANALLGMGLGDDMENGSNKKARVVWSVEMHQQFVNAVNQLGIDKAVPKKILEIMNVDGLTRENVASHLQKYRLYLKRVAGVQQPPQQQRSAKPSPPPPSVGAAAAGNGPAGCSGNGHGAAQQQQQATQGGLNGVMGNGSSHGAAGSAGMGSGPGGGGDAAGTGGMSAAAAAVAAAAGGFPNPLLAANPMLNAMTANQAAAAGLNPLLGAMGGLGSLNAMGAMNPLGQLPMPGMQPPMGLLPGIPGAGAQSGMGPLGPLGLPGLPPGLPGMPGLSLGAMNGLQQMAAANFMQGMAGMGQLPGLGMNGLMGPMLPGMGLQGAQPQLFPHAHAQAQAQQQQQCQQPASVLPQAPSQSPHSHQQPGISPFGPAGSSGSMPQPTIKSEHSLQKSPNPQLPQHQSSHRQHHHQSSHHQQHHTRAGSSGTPADAAGPNMLDLSNDLLSGLMMADSAFPAGPAAPPAHGHGPSGLDASMLLGEDPSDMAAVFGQMYDGEGAGGPGGAGVSGGALALPVEGGMLNDPMKGVMDDDFFSYLLKS